MDGSAFPPPRPDALAEVGREAYVFLGAGATVLLQLAHPGVGHGVADHSNTLQRPLDRLRTTMTYIYAVALGTDEERRAVAGMVNRAHGPVHSASYSAFDPALQLWVAATLYKGGARLSEIFEGPLAPERAEALYQAAALYGTTLQMPAELWPRDREAFDRYWAGSLASFQVDDKVRAYVHALLEGGRLPWWIRPLMPLQRFFTRALLPADLRCAFGLAWTARDQRRWDRFLRWGPRLYRLLPRFIRQLPARYFLHDMRRRLAARRHLI